MERKKERLCGDEEEFELKSRDDESEAQDEDAVYLIEETYAPEGSKGWLIVLAALLMHFVVAWIWDTYAALRIRIPGVTNAQHNYLQYALLYLQLLTGPFASALAEKFGFRRTAMFGSALATMGMLSCFVASIDKVNFYSLLFGFGVFGGIGTGLMATLSFVIVGLHFDKNRPIAFGISLLGQLYGHSGFTPIPITIAATGGWQVALICGAVVCALSSILPMAFIERPKRTVRVRKCELRMTSTVGMPLLKQLRELFSSPSYLTFCLSFFLYKIGHHGSTGPALSRAARYDQTLFDVILLVSIPGFALLANLVGNYLLISNVLLTICAVVMGLSPHFDEHWNVVAFFVANSGYVGIFTILRPLIIMDIVKEKKLNMGFGLSQVVVMTSLVVHEMGRRVFDGFGLLLLTTVLGYAVARLQIWEERTNGRDGIRETDQTG